jgi:hypothetical protein
MGMTQQRVPRIDDYEPLIGAEKADRIRKKADKFKGLRVANFNSTYYGGGVAETLSSLTLLMNSLGLRSEWRVTQGTADFFSITKKMHNALQGGKIDLSSIKKEIFEQVIYENSLRNFLTPISLLSTIPNRCLSSSTTSKSVHGFAAATSTSHSRTPGYGNTCANGWLAASGLPAGW